MNWIELNSIEQFNKIVEEKSSEKVLIFKHSNRCSISSMAKNRMESNWPNLANNKEIYFLDLIKFRDLSNHIAETTGVQHESPQILIIENGECIYNASHSAISPKVVFQELE